MLFGPKDCEKFRDAKANCRQAVKAGVACGANGDEPVWLVNCAFAMVDVKDAVFGAAARASKVIAGEDGLAVAAETRPRMPAGAIAPCAKPRNRRCSGSAGAEQGFLSHKPGGGRPQQAFLAANRDVRVRAQTR